MDQTTMGLAISKEASPARDADRADSVISSKLHGRQASIRQSTIKAKAKQPMPDPNELERRFTKVLLANQPVG
ncbi:hypothetical protein NQ318_018452 [Aromia moschata]|uniref:Uncharacterized protein n=1 Tax=Aromia moschata TaxID=1265417 RepID=A0AAV8YN99_9CUCU|nr:hypothetical protein NQ318_018452 [Aromia moschata]